jgi:hypothetical protein
MSESFSLAPLFVAGHRCAAKTAWIPGPGHQGRTNHEEYLLPAVPVLIAQRCHVVPG